MRAQVGRQVTGLNCNRFASRSFFNAKISTRGFVWGKLGHPNTVLHAMYLIPIPGYDAMYQLSC